MRTDAKHESWGVHLLQLWFTTLDRRPFRGLISQLKCPILDNGFRDGSISSLILSRVVLLLRALPNSHFKGLQMLFMTGIRFPFPLDLYYQAIATPKVSVDKKLKLGISPLLALYARTTFVSPTTTLRASMIVEESMCIALYGVSLTTTGR